MYRHSLAGSYYEMGWKLGDFFIRNKIKFPIKLDKFQTIHGKESLKILNRYFPEAVEEIKGITNRMNYDFELFGAWMMCMGCCNTIRENHNVEVRGCTAFSFVHEDSIYYGRNNDLPPYLKKVSKSIYYQPENKNSFLINTSSFVNGEEGINEYGLVVAMTFVMPEKGEIKPGLNSLFLVRYLLEKCRTVREGLSALKNLPVSSSCNILLADKSNETVVVECNPFKLHLRKPELNKLGNSFIVTVNHFTSSEMSKHDRSNKNMYSSALRYETAYNALENFNHNDAVRFTKELLNGKYGFMCQYKKIKFDTIWSTVFDITNNKVFVAAGNPQKEKFVEDKRLTK